MADHKPKLGDRIKQRLHLGSVSSSHSAPHSAPTSSSAHPPSASDMHQDTKASQPVLGLKPQSGAPAYEEPAARAKQYSPLQSGLNEAAGTGVQTIPNPSTPTKQDFSSNAPTASPQAAERSRLPFDFPSSGQAYNSTLTGNQQNPYAPASNEQNVSLPNVSGNQATHTGGPGELSKGSSASRLASAKPATTDVGLSAQPLHSENKNSPQGSLSSSAKTPGAAGESLPQGYASGAPNNTGSKDKTYGAGEGKQTSSSPVFGNHEKNVTPDDYNDNTAGRKPATGGQAKTTFGHGGGQQTKQANVTPTETDTNVTPTGTDTTSGAATIPQRAQAAVQQVAQGVAGYMPSSLDAQQMSQAGKEKLAQASSTVAQALDQQGINSETTKQKVAEIQQAVKEYGAVGQEQASEYLQQALDTAHAIGKDGKNQSIAVRVLGAVTLIWLAFGFSLRVLITLGIIATTALILSQYSGRYARKQTGRTNFAQPAREGGSAPSANTVPPTSDAVETHFPAHRQGTHPDASVNAFKAPAQTQSHPAIVD